MNQLAIKGGIPVRRLPFPDYVTIGREEKEAVIGSSIPVCSPSSLELGLQTFTEARRYSSLRRNGHGISGQDMQ